MLVMCADIRSYFPPLSVYCVDRYVALDVCDFRSTSNNCGSPACLICRQDSGTEESMNAGSLFSYATTMVGTPEV